MLLLIPINLQREIERALVDVPSQRILATYPSTLLEQAARKIAVEVR